MRKKFLCVLIFTALLVSMPLAPLAQTSATKETAEPGVDSSTFLVDIASNAPSLDGAYPSETKKIAAILGRDSRKNPILIDPTGNDRELVVQAAAVYLASRSSDKRIVGIDWNALLSTANGEREADAAFAAILRRAEESHGKTVLYVEDISTFSKDRPLLGNRIGARLYNAIVGGKVQILTSTNPETFLDQIASDTHLKGRFARIDIEDVDPFVGDKVSPDLRQMIASGDPNRI